MLIDLLFPFVIAEKQVLGAGGIYIQLRTRQESQNMDRGHPCCTIGSVHLDAESCHTVQMDPAVFCGASLGRSISYQQILNICVLSSH